MSKKIIEVELRGPLRDDQHIKLVKKLKSSGSFISKQNRLTEYDRSLGGKIHNRNVGV